MKPARLMKTVALLSISGSSLLATAGCAVRHAADPARLTDAGARDATPTLAGVDGPSAMPVSAAADATGIAWPARDTSVLDDRIWMHPGRHRLYMAGLEGLRDGGVKPYIWSGDVRVLQRRRAGLGVLCQIQRLDAEPAWYDPRMFVFYSSQTPVMRADRAKGPPAPSQHGLDGTPMDGIMYRLREESRGTAPQGVVFALRPLSGGTFIRSTLKELRDRGWVVVETGSGFGIAGIGDERDAGTDDELRSYGRRIGQLVDERLGEWAYGCEAMLEMIRADRPELADKPVVVCGFSAGAIGAPAVAARLGDQVRAVVLVGGGVNVLRIAQTSALSDFGLGVKFRGRRVAGHELDVLSDAYLGASRLDGANAARLLRRTPALVLHASRDDIVPAASGEELYETLGRPERWTFDLGHEMLFLTLGAYDAKIARWVQSTAGGRRIDPQPALQGGMMQASRAR